MAKTKGYKTDSQTPKISNGVNYRGVNYRDVVLELERRERFGFRFGLGRIRKFLKELDNPERKLRIIHIAGTNGKGSTAAFTAKILEFAGYRVGLYTSPHLLDIRERIQINGECISRSNFVSLYSRLSAISLQLSAELTYFEFLTVLAFKYFWEKKIDFLVLEAGLGGRLDATNAIEKPLVAVITNIDYEHTEYLGKTLQKIAYEKAGIIKRDGFTVTGIKQKKVLSSLKETCLQKKNRLFCLGKDFQVTGYRILDTRYQIFNYKGIFGNYENLRIKLLGRQQIENAALSVAITEVLKFHNIHIPEKAIREGLEETSWPGRLEICKLSTLNSKPITVLLDGAHNPAGMRILKENLKIIPTKRRIAVLGILSDKDIRRMVKEICPAVDEIILTEADYYRAADPEVLYLEAKKYFPSKKIFIRKNVKEAIKFSLSRIEGEKDCILVTGSLYVVAEAKKALKQYKFTSSRVHEFTSHNS